MRPVRKEKKTQSNTLSTCKRERKWRSSRLRRQSARFQTVCSASPSTPASNPTRCSQTTKPRTCLQSIPKKRNKLAALYPSENILLQRTLLKRTVVFCGCLPTRGVCRKHRFHVQRAAIPLPRRHRTCGMLLKKKKTPKSARTVRNTKTERLFKATALGIMCCQNVKTCGGHALSKCDDGMWWSCVVKM